MSVDRVGFETLCTFVAPLAALASGVVKHLEQLLLPVHQVPRPCPSDSLRLLQLFYYKCSLIRLLRLMGALASNFLLFSAALALVSGSVVHFTPRDKHIIYHKVGLSVLKALRRTTRHAAEWSALGSARSWLCANNAILYCQVLRLMKKLSCFSAYYLPVPCVLSCAAASFAELHPLSLGLWVPAAAVEKLLGQPENASLQCSCNWARACARVNFYFEALPCLTAVACQKRRASTAQ